MTSAETNPEYNNLMDLICLAASTASRDEIVKIQGALGAYHEAAQRAVADVQYADAGRAFTNGWNEAHDSCSEAVSFLLNNYGPGLSPEAKLALEWAGDRITFVSFPSHTPTDDR